jgi:molybdenum cofactor cytidylyltransferase
VPAAVVAIILAAGESSRMGRPKPLLPINGSNGETFLGHLVTELDASRATRTVVVLGHRADDILATMPEVKDLAVINTNYQLGQLSSLQVGLEAVGPADAIVMCLVDHPDISRQVVSQVIDAFESTRAPIVIPTHQGRRGHPTLFAARLFDELRAAPLDQGARVVVHAHVDEILELPIDDDEILADLDTPEQYQAWLARREATGR